MKKTNACVKSCSLCDAYVLGAALLQMRPQMEMNKHLLHKVKESPMKRLAEKKHYERINILKPVFWNLLPKMLKAKVLLFPPMLLKIM